MLSKKKVQIVGTHGVPAKYGGFETLADYFCQHTSSEFDITVYCNGNIYKEKLITYEGAKLVYLPIDANGVKGIIYDLISYIMALLKGGVILYLSPVGSGFMTPLRFFFPRVKVIVNHGGLNEWEREKLSWLQKKWAKFNHWVASKTSTVNIADNELYKKSLKENFKTDSVVIRYGGDHVKIIDREDARFQSKYSYLPDRYAVSVSRAQIDNNLHLVLEAFEKYDKLKIVLVSNWHISDYGKNLKQKYASHKNMILLDAIYDKEELDYVRGNAYVYVHSHSRCGTSPSLVEAMNLGKAILSIDVETNRETTKNKAQFFSNVQDLKDCLGNLDDNWVIENSRIMNKIGIEEYSWENIIKQYKELI